MLSEARRAYPRRGFTAALGMTNFQPLRLPRLNAMVVIASIPTLVIIFLLVLTASIGFRESAVNATFTGRHYLELYTDSTAYTAFLNTLGFAAVTLVVALCFGVPIPWLVERTDLRVRTLVYAVVTVSLLVPGFVIAMGWIFLLHPRIGMVNQMAMNLLGRKSAPLSVLSIPGMGWVQGLGLASLVFVRPRPVCAPATPR